MKPNLTTHKRFQRVVRREMRLALKPAEESIK